MIINVSRLKAYNRCHQDAFNRYHRMLEGQRSMNLVDGGAFHDGVAHGMATKNWDGPGGAYDAATLRFEKDVASSPLPPEQLFLVDQHRELVTLMIDCYRDNYKDEDYEVIQPECEFDVELPGGRHNCIWLHHIDIEDDEERWGPPDAEKILRHSVMSPHVDREDPTCRCYTPHRFVGKTDNVIAWHHNIWLQEHKTTAIAGPQFWDQWLIDVQPTAYMYGVWKATSVRPSGFVLNAIIKPSEAQVASYNAKRKYGEPKSVKDYIKFEREAFTRTEEDLMRVERQLVNACNEWEMRIRGELEWDMTPTQGACMAYNRRCDFFQMCLSHDEPREMAALGARAPDYVNEKLVQLLPVLPTPQTKENI